ncbi:hypothetical protein [Hyphomicrobium sp. NDB2Meth4]|uniref:hypothetical protein n=1 Tax=Hyphomicrobium sp. NDB2Meth4 TaxID=1892846 RepID=UPI000B0E03E6|nr:hypothetical protein [Hyphomicrobium sp. NDB2Meth4]
MKPDSTLKADDNADKARPLLAHDHRQRLYDGLVELLHQLEEQLAHLLDRRLRRGVEDDVPADARDVRGRQNIIPRSPSCRRKHQGQCLQHRGWGQFTLVPSPLISDAAAAGGRFKMQIVRLAQ